MSRPTRLADHVPAAIADYLLGLLSQRECVLCLDLSSDSRQGALLYGDPAHFGLPAGGTASAVMTEVLIGQDEHAVGLLLEDLQIGSGCPCDVHQLIVDQRRHLLLLDRSQAHERAQRAQQGSHEAQLAHQHLEGRWRRLGSEHEALARRFHELSEMQRLQEGFVRRFAHDFGTPISSVLGHVDLLHDEQRPSAERLRSLQSIRRGVEYLHQLVESVLDQARLENHQFELHPAPCNLSELCADVRDLFEQAAIERGLAWQVELDPAPPGRIEIDALRLRQLLFNLISNAFKFTLHGSVSLQVAWVAGRMSVRVSDTGAGLSAAQQSMLFGEYQRFKSGVRGTGLGLSIVRQILSHMQSDLRVHSVVGLGSRFEFDIPAPRAATSNANRRGISASAAQGDADMASSTTATIAGRPPLPARSAPESANSALVIDDDPDLGLLLAVYLDRLGWRTQVWQAWQQFAGPSPGLVIVDLSLDAELSGLTVIKQARQCWPDAIVIAMSADRSQHVQALSLKAGAWAFLGKPISEHVLGHTLERCKVGDP